MNLATKNCGLFIGVEDYRMFDPSGGRDLLGGRADARAFFKICLDLGIPAENLRICTSPRLDAAELIPPGCCYDATAKSIKDGLEWLAGKLAEGRAGLLTYSGHSDWTKERGVILCPSDVSRDLPSRNLRNFLPFVSIEQRLGQHGGNRAGTANLTVVLDTCQAAADREDISQRYWAGRLTGTALKVATDKLERDLESVGDRVLAACGPKELALRARFSGVDRGAFSWAVTSALEHWKHEVVDGRLVLDLSCGDLLARAKKLLSALSFPQTPVLLHRGKDASLAAFFQAGASGAGKTSREPTARRPGGQLEPEHNYRIRLSRITTQTWEVCATGQAFPPGSGYESNTEYWALDSTFVTTVGTARDGDGLTFEEKNYERLSGPPPFMTPTTPNWEIAPGTPSGPMFWCEDGRSCRHVGLSFALTAGSPWTGTITWYAASPAPSEPGSSVVTGTTTFTWNSDAPALPAGYRWYKYTATL